MQIGKHKLRTELTLIKTPETVKLPLSILLSKLYIFMFIHVYPYINILNWFRRS